MPIQTVFESLPTKLIPLNFPGALIENGRLGNVEAVIGAFGTIMSALRGEIICEVTTAKVRSSSRGH